MAGSSDRRFEPGTSTLESDENSFSPSEIPEAVLAVWNDLPEPIRNDPFLSPFRRGYEQRMRAGPPNVLPSAINFMSSDETPKRDYKVVNMMQEGFHSLTESEEKIASEELPTITIPKYKGWQWRHFKIVSLFLLWLTFTITLMIKSEKVTNMYEISVPENKTQSYWILQYPSHEQISITVQGAIMPEYYSNMTSKHMIMWLEQLQYRHYSQLISNLSTFREQHIITSKNISRSWVIPLVSKKEFIGLVPNVRTTSNIQLNFTGTKLSAIIRLQMKTNMNADMPLAISCDLSPISNSGILYGALVLLGLYILIVFEVIHRTLAAVVASTISLAILAAMNERPTMAELISWIDAETLLLLFSMMIMVTIFAETGVLDYLAVFAYKITSGRAWPLINTLCVFTATLSCFLDNVTTVLLMTPVTIRLCEVLELNPVPILMAMTMYSNIGGALTPVGDPPNVIIASNPDIVKAGVDFSTFMVHMGIGVVITMFLINWYLQYIFKNIKSVGFEEPKEIEELKHEIQVWQKAAASLPSYSRDEDIIRNTLLRSVTRLSMDLDQKLASGRIKNEAYRSTLQELQMKYPIRDQVLLLKSSIALLFVIMLFFLHSIPELKLSLGWTAFLGAILLLLLADNEDMEGVLARVEWSTLLFFAALFVLMEALSRLGLIDWIGHQTVSVIMYVGKTNRLITAIMLILWVSAITSSFVDNIPLTTMMVRIITSLSQNQEIGLPLQPLVWALAFGACFGGNGTLIGSSANVVCAGVAEQHGYRFTFMQYFKVGFPVMIMSTTIVSFYLFLAHYIFSWH